MDIQRKTLCNSIAEKISNIAVIKNSSKEPAVGFCISRPRREPGNNFNNFEDCYRLSEHRGAMAASVNRFFCVDRLQGVIPGHSGDLRGFLYFKGGGYDICAAALRKIAVIKAPAHAHTVTRRVKGCAGAYDQIYFFRPDQGGTCPVRFFNAITVFCPCRRVLWRKSSHLPPGQAYGINKPLVYGRRGFFQFLKPDFAPGGTVKQNRPSRLKHGRLQNPLGYLPGECFPFCLCQAIPGRYPPLACLLPHGCERIHC